MPKALFAFVLIPLALTAQANKQPETARDAVVVTGVYEPIPLEEADRSVRVFDVRESETLINTFADFLKLDSSIDMRQRAPNTIQSDVSIRGGGFGQTLVLLDGLRMNDVQSGHHNFDIPIPLQSLERIEVLKGSGSTLYGSDAVGGVVNFLTRRPESPELRIRTGIGNFGTNQQAGSLAWAWKKASQQFSFSRDFSTGFIENRDYRNLSFTSSTFVESGLGATRVTLASNDRPFGAEQFYGNFNSWERTRTWFASAHQNFGRKTSASVAFRRHTDLFVLYRDRPSVFTNRHAVEGWQASVRRQEELGANVRFHYGVEGFRDAIVSNNLRNHDRARGAAYAALDVRALRRFSFSLGVRDEVFGSADHQWSPTVAAGWWVTPALKVRAAVSRAFRLPTYTDLYYQDPGNRGSPDLRPERAWSYEGGVDWNAGGRWRASAVVFQRREQDGIDYVRRSAAEIWRATNFQNLLFTGVELLSSVRLRDRQQLDFTYTHLRGAQEALAGVQSKYVFNYPVHSGVLGWQGEVGRHALARTRLGVLERLSRDPYAVWDVYASGSHRRVRPFVQFTNLGDTRYQEITGVAMPGRAVLGGLELVFPGAR